MGSIGLSFETNGLCVGLCINNYKKRKDATNEWCKVDFEVKMEHYVEYSIESKEVLLSYEVEKLREELIHVLENDNDLVSIVSFSEPDFSFEFSATGTGDNKKVHIAKWNVQLPFNGVTNHSISISLTRKEVELLKDYLSLITDMTDIDSMEIHRWVQNGNIIF